MFLDFASQVTFVICCYVTNSPKTWRLSSPGFRGAGAAQPRGARPLGSPKAGMGGAPLPGRSPTAAAVSFSPVVGLLACGPGRLGPSSPGACLCEHRRQSGVCAPVSCDLAADATSATCSPSARSRSRA